MRTKQSFCAIGFGLLGGALLVTVACSSSSHPPAEGNNFSPPDVGTIVHRMDGGSHHQGDAQGDGAVTHSEGGPPSDSTMEAEPFDGSDLCTGVTLSGSPVQEEQFPGTIPTLTGGTITSGTYVLTRAYSYPGGDAMEEEIPVVVQQTLILNSGTYKWAVAVGTVDAGLGPTTITGGTFTTGGTNLTFTQTCSSAGATDAGGADSGATTLNFQASASSLYLNFGSTEDFYEAM
jgi:hypothetical protein